MDSGAQLSSGRLVIPMDYIHGQWSSYPITHARSSVLYSDDHVRRRSVVSNSPRLLCGCCTLTTIARYMDIGCDLAMAGGRGHR